MLSILGPEDRPFICSLAVLRQVAKSESQVPRDDALARKKTLDLPILLQCLN
jgi:hypothetical protein